MEFIIFYMYFSVFIWKCFYHFPPALLHFAISLYHSRTPNGKALWYFYTAYEKLLILYGCFLIYFKVFYYFCPFFIINFYCVKWFYRFWIFHIFTASVFRFLYVLLKYNSLSISNIYDLGLHIAQIFFNEITIALQWYHSALISRFMVYIFVLYANPIFFTAVITNKTLVFSGLCPYDNTALS